MIAPAGIICIEGADGSGKTTLVHHLVDHHGARSMHSRMRRDAKKWHFGILRRALRLVLDGELVVLDRHWISEMVYSPIFGGPCYPTASDGDLVAEAFDMAIAGSGVYVLCVPRDARAHLKRFEELKATGREQFDNIERVIQTYTDLLFGNIAHPGDNYLDKYCRFGDFTDVRRVIHYDMDRDGKGLNVVTNRILRELRDVTSLQGD